MSSVSTQGNQTDDEGGPDAAAPFGSYARGNRSPDSDVDVRLLCGSGMTYGALYEIQLALQRQLGCESIS